MTRIIVAATSIDEHVAPMLAVARDLVARGHDVTFVTGSRYRDSVEATGATFEPVAGAADIDAAAEAARPERLALPPTVERFAYDMQVLFTDAIPEQFKVLEKLVAEADEPVVIVHEAWFWGAIPYALLDAKGPAPAAIIAVGTMQSSVSGIDLTPCGAGLPPGHSDAGQLRNKGLHGRQLAGPLGATQRHYEKTLRNIGVLGEVPYFLETVARHADRLLQLSLEELSYLRSDLPASAEFVGALPAPVSDADLPAWWNHVHMVEKVVVVTQGTFTNHDLSELVEPTMQALATLPVLVVVITGSDVALTNVPGNVRVARYIPLGQLLPETDVLITDGGFDGVQQALSLGVPVVLSAAAEATLGSHARIAATGAAIDLATQRPTPRSIRAAVLKILLSKDYHVAAGRLQSQYAALDPLAAVATTVEELSSGEPTDLPSSAAV